MKLRRLNDDGIRRLSEFLDSLTGEAPQPCPQGLLDDPDASEPVEPPAAVDQCTFENRFEAGRYLHQQLSDSGIPDLERDRGIWAWLSLFYFDQLCPADARGRRHPGERARWIPETEDFRKYYRHLLAGPWRIYRAHRDRPERALAVLCTPLHSPGDLAEQLASRQELVTSKPVMEAATMLYVDPSTHKPRRGARGRGPGSARRLAQVLDQFVLTWDLYSMDAKDLLAMLPQEFDRFRPGEEAAS